MGALTERRSAVLRVLAAHSGEFEWGVRDCVTLAADVVHAIRGERVIDYSWRTDDEAEAELARRGGLQAAVTDCLGAAYSPRETRPEDGDVVLVRLRGFEMLAVWAGVGPIGPASKGLHRLDPAHAVAGWRV